MSQSENGNGHSNGSNDRVSMNREEYQALLALRDETMPLFQGTHDELKMQLIRLRAHLVECTSVNSQQLVRLQSAVLTNAHLNEQVLKLEEQVKRLSQLETPDKLADRNLELEKLLHRQFVKLEELSRGKLAENNEKLLKEVEQLKAELKPHRETAKLTAKK